MVYKTHSDVFIYHDETGKIEGRNVKGHVFLIVPSSLSVDRDSAQTNLVQPTEARLESLSPLKFLSEEILAVRNKYEAFKKFHFRDIGGKKWNNRNNAEVEVLKLGIDSFRRNKQKTLNKSLCCKLAAIFYPSTPLSSYGGHRAEREYRYYETTLRFLLKGSLHFLYDDNNTVEVNKIISGGTPYHRTLDSDRIAGILLGDNSMRAYVTFSPNFEIVHQTSDHAGYGPDTEQFMHSTMLQLADLFLGCVRYVVTTSHTKRISIPHVGATVANKKALISHPVAEMWQEWSKNPYSRRCDFHKSISMTEASLKEGNWEFNSLRRLGNDPTLLDYCN